MSKSHDNDVAIEQIATKILLEKAQKYLDLVEGEIDRLDKTRDHPNLTRLLLYLNRARDQVTKAYASIDSKFEEISEEDKFRRKAMIDTFVKGFNGDKS